MRRENASVQGLSRQLGCSWKTLWRAIQPVLQVAAADEDRFVGVTTFGVDEHVWHHVSTKPVEQGGRGPKEFTGMVDLTRDQDGHLRARLLDLVPGRSGEAYKTWLRDRGDAFRKRVQVATLDPFHGYKNAIDDQPEDAVAVLDAFHIVKLGTAALDEVRRRVQQPIHGHRGRKHDPLYRIRNILRAGVEHLTDRQQARLEAAFVADERHLEGRARLALRPTAAIHLPPTRPRPRAPDRGAHPRLVPHLPDPRDSPPRPNPEPVAQRVPRLLHTTHGANNGGTEAINGLIEPARRVARRFSDPDNYRIRMLLIGGGLRL